MTVKYHSSRLMSLRMAKHPSFFNANGFLVSQRKMSSRMLMINCPVTGPSLLVSHEVRNGFLSNSSCDCGQCTLLLRCLMIGSEVRPFVLMFQMVYGLTSKIGLMSEHNITVQRQIAEATRSNGSEFIRIWL